MSADRELPEPPKRPSKRDARASWRVRLGRLPWHLDKLRQLEEAIEVTLANKRFNAAGLAALMLRAQDARERIDGILAERPDEIAGMSADELVAWARLALASWPDQVLEVALALYCQRHRGHLEFVGEAGHRAVFDPLEGTWSRGG